MPTTTVRVMTEGDGTFSRQEEVNPPGPFNLSVELKAVLLTPADTEVSGTLDIDSTDGNPQNEAQTFSLAPGQEISLGRWRLDGGKNVIKVSGQTYPSRPHTLVEIEIDASL